MEDGDVETAAAPPQLSCLVPDLPPAGLSWAEYVERWVADRGGWLPLADRLIHRAGDAVEIVPAGISITALIDPSSFSVG